MSVLIKSVEMPETCGKCPFCQFGGLDLKLRCLVTDESIINFDAKEKRARNCPLVEIPPHGDLIDRDKLMKSLEHEWDICMDDTEFANKIVPNGIKDAATVIESEVEE